jgi:hypothetical protein
MPMPEAALDLNDRFVLPQHNVGASRQLADMQAKSVTKTMQRPSDSHLGMRVLRADF